MQNRISMEARARKARQKSTEKNHQHMMKRWMRRTGMKRRQPTMGPLVP
jgi:hypothetical protein